MLTNSSTASSLNSTKLSCTNAVVKMGLSGQSRHIEHDGRPKHTTHVLMRFKKLSMKVRPYLRVAAITLQDTTHTHTHTHTRTHKLAEEKRIQQQCKQSYNLSSAMPLDSLVILAKAFAYCCSTVNASPTSTDISHAPQDRFRFISVKAPAQNKFTRTSGDVSTSAYPPCLS